MNGPHPLTRRVGRRANTVGTHVRAVFTKLDVRSRVQRANLPHTRQG